MKYNNEKIIFTIALFLACLSNLSHATNDNHSQQNFDNKGFDPQSDFSKNSHDYDNDALKPYAHQTSNDHNKNDNNASPVEDTKLTPPTTVPRRIQ